MESGLLSILIFIILVLFSAYFSSTETAFTSLSTAKLKKEEKKGDNSSRQTLDLHKKFDSLLSTILLGNNLVNIAASSIATVFFVNISPRYGAVIATIVTTLLLLLFGEITPKLLAKGSPESLAKFSTPFLKFFMAIFGPFVWFFQMWQRLVRKVFPISNSNSISEEDLLSIVDEAQMSGSIEFDEHELVRAAINFDDVEVATILTPRVDVVAVDIEDSDSEIEHAFENSGYSRLVVYDEVIDEILGVLHQKDFNRYLRAKFRGTLRFSTIEALLQPANFVHPGMLVSESLKLMQINKVHMCVVVDEYGGTAGIITMEDALEELVGEIWDETDIETKDEIAEIEPGKVYSASGTFSIDKLLEHFELNVTDEEILSTSVSGFIIEQLERVPEEGDSFTFQNLLIEVTDTSNRRATDVRIEKLETNIEQESTE